MKRGALRHGMRFAADALAAAVLAPPCIVCGKLLERATSGPVCPACWAAIEPVTPPVCDTCGDPLPSWRVASLTAGRCARCRRRKPAVDRARALGPYEGPLRAIVHALKYEGRRSLAAPLGALMRRHGADLVAGADCAVPVPLHWRRRRARGFNQARDLAAALGLPVVVALRRVRATPPQTGLPAAQRHRNVREAFAPARRLRWLAAWGRPLPVVGRCVLLVDDVATTGATLDACARVLKQLGAREVRALTAARTVRGRP